MPKGQKKVTPIRQLTEAERAKVDKLVRTEGKTPTQALQRINAARDKDGVQHVHKSTVHRFCRGLTHKRGAKETRGRKTILAKKDIVHLDRTRRQLIKKANNQHRVKYDDVIKEAGLEGVASQRVCEDALRDLGVGFLAPRRKIYVSEEDAKKRRQWAETNKKRPAKYWTEEIKAYVDNKSFPTPRTPAQRTRFKQTLITGHLRKKSEGLDRGFTKPREKNSFIGIPSVQISAAVSSDKIIMWHVVAGNWNGKNSAIMYKDHLKPALKRKYGELSHYKIIEDGDRKGNQSNRGIAAKKEAKIKAVTLPPRTPSLMQLDYSIWQRIVRKMVETMPSEGTESMDEFLARLRKIATRLPKKYIKSVIDEMPANVRALADAKGYTPKKD